jgi:hypothetical protein
MNIYAVCQCPTCGLSGVTPERAREIAPRYLAALESLPERSYPVPDEPHAECWDCRVLRREGYDPAELVAPVVAPV